MIDGLEREKKVTSYPPFGMSSMLKNTVVDRFELAEIDALRRLFFPRGQLRSRASAVTANYMKHGGRPPPNDFHRKTVLYRWWGSVAGCRYVMYALLLKLSVSSQPVTNTLSFRPLLEDKYNQPIARCPSLSLQHRSLAM
jgi:hypothetical protein